MKFQKLSGFTKGGFPTVFAEFLQDTFFLLSKLHPCSFLWRVRVSGSGSPGSLSRRASACIGTVNSGAVHRIAIVVGSSAIQYLILHLVFKETKLSAITIAFLTPLEFLTCNYVTKGLPCGKQRWHLAAPSPSIKTCPPTICHLVVWDIVKGDIPSSSGESLPFGPWPLLGGYYPVKTYFWMSSKLSIAWSTQ